MMEGLASEDVLILGVAFVIVLNRAFTSTALRLSRAAYVVIQLFNLSAVLALFWFRLDGFPGNLDRSVRVFLMFFVAFHMVLANQGRAKALRARVLDRREAERAKEDKAKRREELMAMDAAHYNAGNDAPD